MSFKVYAQRIQYVLVFKVKYTLVEGSIFSETIMVLYYFKLSNLRAVLVKQQKTHYWVWLTQSHSVKKEVSLIDWYLTYWHLTRTFVSYLPNISDEYIFFFRTDQSEAKGRVILGTHLLTPCFRHVLQLCYSV